MSTKDQEWAERVGREAAALGCIAAVRAMKGGE